jgi:hypothetical protein
VQAAGQHRVLIAVTAGEVDRKAPGAGRAGIAQPAQRQDLAIGQVAVDVGELATKAHPDRGQAWPALALAGS